MTNFNKITELRDHLVWLKENNKAYKFNMTDYLQHKDAVENYKHYAGTVRNLKAHARIDKVSPYECGTAACLAGHVALLHNVGEDEIISDFAQDILNLNSEERYHMFMGGWIDGDMTRTTIDEAIEYLNKVLDEQNVMVKI